MTEWVSNNMLEEEVEVILMERIRDKANAERYDRMIAKREEQIAEAKNKSKNCRIFQKCSAADRPS